MTSDQAQAEPSHVHDATAEPYYCPRCGDDNWRVDEMVLTTAVVDCRLLPDGRVGYEEDPGLGSEVHWGMGDDIERPVYCYSCWYHPNGDRPAPGLDDPLAGYPPDFT